MIDRERIRLDAEAPVLAGARDLAAVIGDLSAAFADDVMFDWFLRADARRDRGRRAFFNGMVSAVIPAPVFRVRNRPARNIGVGNRLARAALSGKRGALPAPI